MLASRRVKDTYSEAQQVARDKILRSSSLTIGQLCPIVGIMKGSEFIRKVKKLAKERGVKARVEQKRGKGSHVTLYFGPKFTIVRNPKDELKTGTFKAMLSQLGIKEDEL